MAPLLDDLRGVLPAAGIITAPADLAPFITDWRGLYHNPAICAVLPETTEQVAAIIRIAAARRISIVPQGGNTGLVAGGVPVADAPQLVLNLRRMNRIIGFDAVGDSMTVQAGVTLHAVREAAAARDRLFPVSFGAEGSAQIGGAIATNAGGIQVLAYGSMRAQVLGLEVVLADGRVWNGLRALAKDNTGFDLKQVFIGGEGTLGIITQAVLKLRPAVTASATALIGLAGPAAALELFARLRAGAGAALTCCEFMTREALELGIAHLPGARAPFASPSYLLAELSGHGPDEGLNTRLEAVLQPALESGDVVDAVIAQSARERAEFIAWREAIPEGERAEGGAVKHDISVPLAALPATVAAIETCIAQGFADCRLNIFGHVGDGNLHVNVRPPAGQTLADLGARKTAITEAVERIAMAHEGSFSAEHGIGQMRLPGMAAHKSEVELDLMRALKAALDPGMLFNPGKMLP
jgi:FAD/FMN-containing dehydrogenase